MIERWRLAGVVGTAALGILLCNVAYAELRVPKLRARSRPDATIRLTWGGVRAPRGAVTVVEIERAAGGGAFEALGTFPPRPRRIADMPVTPGVYTYRARVITDDQVSLWSEYATAEVVDESPAATPTPMPTPTATPAGGGDDPALEVGMRECAPGTLDQVLALVNDARRTAGAAALSDNAALRRAARIRTITLAETGDLSHGNWVEVIRQAGYRGGYAAENIAYGYASPGAVVNGWLGSAGHRANMLNGIFRDSGIGCVIDANGRYWWTHDLGG